MPSADGRHSALAVAHAEEPDFLGWPVASIRVLRALHHGPGRVLYGEPRWMDTPEVEAASADLGEPITYPAARNGCRWLVDGGYRWTRGDDDNIQFAEENVFAGKTVQRLTRTGQEWARISFEAVAAGDHSLEPAATAKPPDPQTPLWRVLYDDGYALVIAANASAAITLFEQYTAEEAHRAEPIDTGEPVVLSWTLG